MNSRIAEVKNHLLIVEALHDLSQEIREQIVVVCTGDKCGQYYETVLQKIEEYDLRDSFIFTGWVDPYEILTVSDFLFLPSKAEGFSLSSLEAFFMKVPVARTKTGGWEDMKDFCIQISAEDPHPIEKIINYLVRNGKEVFVPFTEQAFRYASENFTVQSMTEKTLDVYRAAIKSLENQ